MRSLIIIGSAVAVFGVGWAIMAVIDGIAEIERAALARDADETIKAERRSAWRNGELIKGITVWRKSKAPQQ